MDNSFIDPLVEKLNSEQKEAVINTEGPILIIAGAGTGKTSVVTTKIAYLIARELAKPEEILALTFTEKAASEMQNRIDIMLPYGLSNIEVNTFHSFGEIILKENALQIGLTPEYKLLNSPEETYFFKENLYKFDLKYYRPISNPTKFIEAILKLFSRLKDENVKEAEYNNFIKNLEDSYTQGNTGKFDSLKTLKEYINIQNELFNTFKQYEILKKEKGFLNFSDLIYLPLNILTNFSTVREYYQNKYKYILVDEYQDTNYSQNEIVKIIADKHKNLCVCGDDDQSIYKFRGASISNILEFQENYPSYKKFILTKNYRSNQEILDCAYRLIQNNNPDRLEVKENIDKRLISVNENFEKSVFSNEFDNLKEEISFVIDKIKELKNQNLDYSDIAILIRSNSQVQSIIRELTINKIPFKYQGNTGLYETTEIRLILSFLYSLASVDDNVNLFNLASSKFYNLSMEALIKCNNYSKHLSKYLSYIFKNIENFPDLELDETDLNIIKQINLDLEKYRELSREINVGNLLYEYLGEKKYFDYLVDENKSNETDNLQKFFQSIDKFINTTNQTSIYAFCDYLDYTREAGSDPSSSETETPTSSVNILTIHRAKGMEFNTVFMIDLIDGRFPTRSMRDTIEIPIELIKETLPTGNFHLEEERRLFYVGMTRAKERLFLLWAKDYYQKTAKKVSPFVKETLMDFEINPTKKEKKEVTKKINIEKHSNLEFISKKEIFSLSQTQIETYLTCPLKYKYLNILKINPPPNHNLYFGSLIHKLIEQILKNEMNGNELSEEDTLETLVILWEDRGFISQEHIDEALQRAKEIIKNFNKRKKEISPKFIEKVFKIKYNENLLIKGRWDLIDNENNIIDFKTTIINDSKEALRKARESTQLKIYSWVYEKEFHVLPNKVELYFVDKNIREGYKPTSKTLFEASRIIESVYQGIINEDYPAQPSFMACSFCPMNKICPFTSSY